LSQGAVARQLTTPSKPNGVWPTYVGQIEKGEKVPSDGLCLRLADVLGLDGQQVLLAAYADRAGATAAGALFSQARQRLGDPWALAAGPGKPTTAWPTDPELLAALAKPGIQALLVALSQTRPGRDYAAVIRRLQAMDDRHWAGLLNLIEAMGF
jgi:transcriptional regulator with XRE-family HTH domain